MNDSQSDRDEVLKICKSSEGALLCPTCACPQLPMPMRAMLAPWLSRGVQLEDGFDVGATVPKLPILAVAPVDVRKV